MNQYPLHCLVLLLVEQTWLHCHYTMMCAHYIISSLQGLVFQQLVIFSTLGVQKRFKPSILTLKTNRTLPFAFTVCIRYKLCIILHPNVTFKLSIWHALTFVMSISPRATFGDSCACVLLRRVGVPARYEVSGWGWYQLRSARVLMAWLRNIELAERAKRNDDVANLLDTSERTKWML